MDVEPSHENEATLAAGVPEGARASTASAWATRGQCQVVAGARYQIERELGRGGFAVVWRALDRETGQPCCLKFLRPEHAHGFPLVRFRREFRTARRLSHEGCVKVGELVQRDGAWFFTMDLVQGTNLHQAHLVDHTQIALVALQVLAALDYIHSHAVVHRDIKPHNILVELTDDRRNPVAARLTDFGIAKVGDLDDDERLLAIRGSPPYLAPEMLLHGVTDPRSDLYALGVTLYELFAGRHPLSPQRGLRARDWLQLIKEREPIPLAEAVPDIPKPLCAVVIRLLATDPAARYRTAAQAYDDLASWLRGHAAPRAVPELTTELTGSPYLAAPRLVGRERERVFIGEFLAATLDAGARAAAQPAAAPLLLLSGPPGVGKSRLLAWLVRSSARYGARVLTGQCRSEVGGPFEGVAAILDWLSQSQSGAPPFAAEPDGAAEPEGTGPTISSGPPGGGAGLAATFAPAAESSRQGLSGSSSGNEFLGNQQGNRRLQQLTGSLLAASTVPTLIVMEDIQWADGETLQLISQWVHAISLHRSEGKNLPVVLVATHRPSEGDDELGELRRALLDSQLAVALELEPFARADAEALAAELLMQPLNTALKAACGHLFAEHPATPLYVSQVLRLLLARGFLTKDGDRWDGTWDLSRLAVSSQVLVPATVEQVIGEQAARLSIDTKALLSVAAVVGRRFSVPVVGEAARLDENLVLECLEEAARAGFVSEDSMGAGETFVFTHDRYREALYAALPAEHRRQLHQTVAETLLAGAADRGRSLAADLALHYDKGGAHDSAYRFAVVAAAQALRGHQFGRASDFYALALRNADAAGRRVPRRVLERAGDAAGGCRDEFSSGPAMLRVSLSTPSARRRPSGGCCCRRAASLSKSSFIPSWVSCTPAPMITTELSSTTLPACVSAGHGGCAVGYCGFTWWALPCPRCSC
jgi:hypothetical protein